jgi:hypothetical protein
MKKIILPFVLLIILFACNEIAKPVEPSPVMPVDSFPKKTDSAKVFNIDKGLGSGLTQEEMLDDSLFSDGSKPTSWQIAGIADAKSFKLFLKQLQLLVLNNDKENLAKLIRYPFSKSIKTEQDFIKNYDGIFTKDAKLSIAKINFSQIYRNNKGVMTEGGKVWFAQVGNAFKIIAVNG